MLKVVGFILLSVGIGLKMPKKIQEYKTSREWHDLLALFAMIMLILGAFLLAFT